MRELAFHVTSVAAALGVGLGWGWMSGRMFGRPLMQDLSALLIGILLGSFVVIGTEVVRFVVTAPGGGLGAVSGGVSEVILMGLPVAFVLAIAGGALRRRIGNVGTVPVAFGGVGALFGAVWAAATISSSVG